MRELSITRLLKKGEIYFYLACLLTVAIVWWKTCNKVHSKYINDCNEEREMEFTGEIKNYSSNVLKEKGFFTLNEGSNFYTIPRSSKAMPLADGDSIFKVKHSNRYFIKRRDFGVNILRKQAVDTFDFDCPTN